MKNKKILLTIAIATILSSTSALASTSSKINGDVNVGVAKTDMSYVGNSLELDSESVSVGLNLRLMDYYTAGFTYSDMSKESDKYEFSLGYLRPINERVALSFGGSYLVYDGFLISNSDEMESLNISIGSEIKLNRDVTFSLGLERADTDYTFEDESEDRHVSTNFYAGLSYDFDEKISVSLYHREFLQETGLRLSWKF